ncbi:MAG: hypothetical protein II837_05845 [Treponema sp.]|nr:hypothetical protein [Treponema sp.]
MKALLKDTYEWVDVETDTVFDDQYNTATRRIFDRDIVRLYEDVRILHPDLCTCGYCGKLCLSKADYEKHVAEEKSKVGKCEGCFWRSVSVDEEAIEEEILSGSMPDGKNCGEEGECLLSRKVRLNYKISCRYAETDDRYGKCTHEAHGALEPKLFDKAYFVKHPYGMLFDSLRLPPSEVTRVYKGASTRTYKIWLNPNTLEWRATAPYGKDEACGKAKIQGWKNGWYSKLDLVTEKEFKANNFLLRDIENFVEDFVGSVALFNGRVADDRNYTQPDGSLLDSVMLNGVKVNRPKPFDVSGWTIEGGEE